MKSLAARILEAREHAGLTQVELARAANMTQQMLTKLETGKSKRTSKITEIAIACGVSPEWLAVGRGAMIAEKWTVREPSPSTYAADDVVQKLSALLASTPDAERAPAGALLEALATTPNSAALRESLIQLLSPPSASPAPRKRKD